MKSLLLGVAVLALTACQAKDTTMIQKTAYALNQASPMSYTTDGQTDADHLWLEEVLGEKALAKVGAWNTRSNAAMKGDVYQDMKQSLLEVYNSPKKIPYISYRKGMAHNFWQDKNHVRGLWRTTTLESYASDNPKWETILDVDALAAREDKNWLYKGNDCFAPEYNRCMVTLSDGGKDAAERREFDIKTKSFVENGFVLSESKGGAAWLDLNTLLVGVDFGPLENGKQSLTDSGYPMVAKLWKRGTPLSSATELMRGEQTDVGTWPGTFENAAGDNEVLVVRATTFYDTQYYWIAMDGDNIIGKVQVPVPQKSSLLEQFKGQQLVRLQEDWTVGGQTFASGAMVSYSIAEFMNTGKISTAHEVITPNARQSIEGTGVTKSALLLSLFENVSGAAYAFDFNDGAWSKTKLDFPQNGTVSIGQTNSHEDIAFINTESFLSPDALWSLDTKTMKTSQMEKTKLKSLPDWFDATSMEAHQYQATSTDGTKIPYFVVHKKDMKLDGTNPTLLYGYGGFEISINPSYSATTGRAWLERGGVFASANIRGGGEFGPSWHQAGLKTKRQIVYDDFFAVAENLIERKITSAKHLGAHGRSNGGLLMGVAYTQRPDLFGAIVCGVPLLDMMRFHKLLAGASWMGEYGNPDDAVEGAYLKSLSPYHNVRADVKYPPIYIYTSTKDDRVHPAHARKLAQRLEDMGHEFDYYENIDGGHAGAANLDETAHSYAMIYSYLADKLGAK